MTQRRFDPRQNQLLASLPDAVWSRWSPHLEYLEMPAGRRLTETGKPLLSTVFPVSGIVALSNTTQAGHATQLAIVGNEGFVGVEVSLGGRLALNVAIVQSAGEGCQLEHAFLQRELDADVALVHLLLRYTQALITQMTQTAVCNRHHSVEQQLCRWLLLSLDRLSSDSLTMTQELIANMLGVRREGVTEAAGKLQRAGLIRYSRGRIDVLDRPGLEKAVCECYAVVKLEFDRLISDIPRGDPLHILGQSEP